MLVQQAFRGFFKILNILTSAEMQIPFSPPVYVFLKKNIIFCITKIYYVLENRVPNKLK